MANFSDSWNTSQKTALTLLKSILPEGIETRCRFSGHIDLVSYTNSAHGEVLAESVNVVEVLNTFLDASNLKISPK